MTFFIGALQQIEKLKKNTWQFVMSKITLLFKSHSKNVLSKRQRMFLGPYGLNLRRAKQFPDSHLLFVHPFRQDGSLRYAGALILQVATTLRFINKYGKP